MAHDHDVSASNGSDSTTRAADAPEQRHDLRSAAAGGAAAAIIGFGGMALVGTTSPFEARRQVEAVLPTVRFAASGYIAGGATVLALMLTLITFSLRNEMRFTATHYRRIRQISMLATVSIISSVLLLMFLGFPIDEADVDADYYVWVFYALVLGGAVIGGIFIAAVLMLFYAVRGLIGIGDPDGVSDLVHIPDDDNSEQADGDSSDVVDDEVAVAGRRGVGT